MAGGKRITVLVENTAFGRDTWAEHGLSFWIDSGGSRVLFDTGQSSQVLCHNAELLGVDLATLDAVVLSHGHYDHTGGLAEVLRVTDDASLFLHPGALSQRFGRKKDESVQEIGLPPPLSREYLEEHASRVVWTTGPTRVSGAVWVTGPVPRETDYEDTGGDFFMDGACRVPDLIEDDQAVFFDTREGTVVLLGCGHAGVVNTLTHIRKLTEDRPIHAVMGGMHLVSASPQRMDRTVRAFSEMEVEILAPAHCTGARAQGRLASEFPDQWRDCRVGSRFEFLSPARPEPA